MLQGEIETLDMYARGEVYGFRLFEFDTEIDSCWGFYGDYGIKDIIAEAGFSKDDMKEVYCDNIDLDDYFEKTFNKEVKWSLKS